MGWSAVCDCGISWTYSLSIWENPALFENRIKPRVYVRRITRCTTCMYVRKSSLLLAGTGVRKISSVACGFNHIQINFSDNPKNLISSINEVYVFRNKISLLRYLIEKYTNFIYNRLLCCNHACSSCVNPVLKRNLFSRTQHSAAGDARTRKPSTLESSTLQLSRCAPRRRCTESPEPTLLA